MIHVAVLRRLATHIPWWLWLTAAGVVLVGVGILVLRPDWVAHVVGLLCLGSAAGGGAVVASRARVPDEEPTTDEIVARVESELGPAIVKVPEAMGPSDLTRAIDRLTEGE